MFRRLLRRISGRVDPSLDRNRALGMAMDWDGDWHGPLGPRLKKELPLASSQEIERIATECAEAMKFGHELAFSLGKAARGTSASWEQEFRQQLCTRHPWIDEQNAHRLLRQGLYYAFKTGHPA